MGSAPPTGPGRGVVRLLNTAAGPVLCLAGEVGAAAVEVHLRRYGREPMPVRGIDAGSVTGLSRPALDLVLDHLDAAARAGRTVRLRRSPALDQLLAGARGGPVEVWFDPSCSKSRAARDVLEEAGADVTLRRYLDSPPTEAELRTVLAALGLEPWDITRRSDPLAGELGVAHLPPDADTWISLLAGNPQLIQRPIVVSGDGRAWIARDGGTLAEALAAARSTGRRFPGRGSG